MAGIGGRRHDTAVRIMREIVDDQDSSASALTGKAVGILLDIALSSKDGCSLSDAAQQIADGKPSMAGLANAARNFAEHVGALGPNPCSKAVVELAKAFRQELVYCAKRAALNASQMIPAEGLVVTCSASSLTLETVRMVRPRRVVVYVERGQYEGHGFRMAQDLAAGGVNVETASSLSNKRGSERPSMAIVGADAVSPGFVVNGSPSLHLAESICGLSPFYVVCERIKFAREVEAADGFDRIPISLVSGVITEDGVIAPHTTGRWIRER